MYHKIYLAFLLMLSCSMDIKAQADYQKTDSITRAQYERKDWKLLLNYGKTAILNGEDFLSLRLRLGDAAFSLKEYSLALIHYEKVLSNDRYHQQALYYASLCNTYLNRTLDASYLTKNLDDKNSNGRIQKPFQLITIGLENAFKSTNTTARGASTYTRLHANLQPMKNLNIDQSLFFFKQSIFTDKIKLSGYHVKFNYMPIQSFTLIVAYNYNNSSYLLSSYQNQSGLLGLKYSHPYFNAQADLNVSRLNDQNIKQLNLQLFNYLTGNLNLYLINRLSLLNSNSVYAGTIGTKLVKNMWAELNGTFGLQENYTEADGLYQFNGIDNTTAKYAINTYILIKKHLLLNIGYAVEKKESNILSINYSQNAINTGIKWNF